MNNFNLKLKLKVIKKLKPTNSILFKDLKIGDEILITCTLLEGRQKGNSDYRNAPKVTVINLTNGAECKKHFSYTQKALECFKFEEII